MVDKSRYEQDSQWPPLTKRGVTAQIRIRRFVVAVGKYAVLVLLVSGLGYALYRGNQMAPRDAGVFTPRFRELRLPSNPLWTRPETAPNGTPWPADSNYIAGYPRLNVFGLAVVVADNTGGSSDLFVKLIDRDQQPMKAVRVFLLKERAKLELHRVKPGHYDVRYQNLSTGRIRRSSVINVKLTKTAAGEQYVGWTVGLYEVLSGNTYHDDISERDF